jgi:hypothetical protein
MLLLRLHPQYTPSDTVPGPERDTPPSQDSPARLPHWEPTAAERDYLQQYGDRHAWGMSCARDVLAGHLPAVMVLLRRRCTRCGVAVADEIDNVSAGCRVIEQDTHLGHRCPLLPAHVVHEEQAA